MSHLPIRCFTRVGIAAAVSSVVLLAAFSSVAQEADSIPALLDEIEAGVAELTDLEKQIRQTDGAISDEETLRSQISSLRSSILEKLYEVGAQIAKQPGDGEPAPQRPRVETLYQRLAADLLGDVDRLESLRSELRKQRDLAASEAKIELDHQVDTIRFALIEAYEAYAEHLTHMQEFGLDVAAERNALAERLDRIAKGVAASIPLASKEVAALEKSLADSPDDAGLKTGLQLAQKKVERRTESLDAVANLLAELDRDTSAYRKVLIETTGQITADVLSGDVAFGLLQGWTARVRDLALENGPQFLFQLVVFIAILAVFRLLANLTRRMVERAVSNSKLRLSQLARSMLVSIAARSVFLLGFLVALSQLGIALGPLLAGLGVAGFIVGFALQDTLGNFAAGAMILVYRPYDVGDLIEASGVFGKVAAMSLVSTRILTVDNQTLVVPNSAIWGNVIKNVTAQKLRRVDLVFGIGYSDDIPRAEQVLESILAEHPKVLDDPQPIVKLFNLGDSSVDFVVRPWCKTDDYWDVHWDVTREVKMRFDREGIGIPFPQRDVHIYREAPESPAEV